MRGRKANPNRPACTVRKNKRGRVAECRTRNRQSIACLDCDRIVAVGGMLAASKPTSIERYRIKQIRQKRPSRVVEVAIDATTMNKKQRRSLGRRLPGTWQISLAVQAYSVAVDREFMKRHMRRLSVKDSCFVLAKNKPERRCRIRAVTAPTRSARSAARIPIAKRRQSSNPPTCRIRLNRCFDQARRDAFVGNRALRGTQQIRSPELQSRLQTC